MESRENLVLENLANPLLYNQTFRGLYYRKKVSKLYIEVSKIKNLNDKRHLMEEILEKHTDTTKT